MNKMVQLLDKIVWYMYVHCSINNNVSKFVEKIFFLSFFYQSSIPRKDLGAYFWATGSCMEYFGKIDINVLLCAF